MLRHRDTLVVNVADETSIAIAVYWLLPHSRMETGQIKEDESTKLLENMLRRILVNVPILTLVMQDNYIDRVYRDCYYIYISSKHFEQSRYCKRVFMFTGTQSESVMQRNEAVLQDAFIGCFVVKPNFYGHIGRTLINPKYIITPNTHAYVRTTSYSVSFQGMLLKIQAFPFSMQDGETLTCAEITLLNIFDYYSNHYADYKFTLPSDIFRIAAQNHHERTLPTHGMNYLLLTRVLTEFGFSPRLYISNYGNSDYEVRRILHYYIESAIPVAIGLKKTDSSSHSIVCIGHGKINEATMLKSLCSISTVSDINDVDSKRFYFADTANACIEYICMDDNHSPYMKCDIKKIEEKIYSKTQYTLNDYKISCLAVPLGKRMNLEAKDAYAICTKIFSSSPLKLQTLYNEYFSNCAHSDIGTIENPLIIRLFLVSSRSFKRFRMSKFSPESLLSVSYNVTPLPRFLWVCELFDKDHYHNGLVLGEIILDATASTTMNLNGSIMISFLNSMASRGLNNKSNHTYWAPANINMPDADIKTDTDTLLFCDIPDWSPYPMYTGNLMG